MNEERLEKVAAFLLTVPEKETVKIPTECSSLVYRKFDLDVWKHSSPATGEFDGTFNCGFSGCAIGWVCHAHLIPGLFMGKIEPEYIDDEGWCHRNWDAVKMVFGINEDAAAWLFKGPYPGIPKSITPKMVSDRIRLLVKCKDLDTAQKVELAILAERDLGDTHAV